MALMDHFHPPLGDRRHWHAFHNAWATYISSDLNRQLPEGYFAEANVKFGIEIDVATFEEARRVSPAQGPVAAGPNGGWTPAQPVMTIPLTVITDTVEVAVFHEEGGPVLAGAIELVSPANKDRPESRGAFVSKWAAYVQQGIGLVVVDVVTERRANLHDELVSRLDPAGTTPMAAALYAAAYRPVRQDEQAFLQIWQEPLTVGQSLPTLPLWLRGGHRFPVDLDASYQRTCQEQRI
jgi:hypothetical protein